MNKYTKILNGILSYFEAFKELLLIDFEMTDDYKFVVSALMAMVEG